jgi:AAA domain, putative AbiEii toxin, Type IV TA system
MRILSFEYRDADGWTLEPMKLDPFNLLVGLSGAGKTRIVRAIERVCTVALGTKPWGWRGVRFAIEFEHDGLTYRWKMEFENTFRDEDDRVLCIQSERIEQGGQLLVERTPDQIIFKEQPIPGLDRGRSAIALFKEDSAMAALHIAFSRGVFQPRIPTQSPELFSTESLEKLRRQYGSVEALGADFSRSLHHKAELLQALFPEAFAEITAAFRDAFPQVETVWVQRYDMANEKYAVVVLARESGVPHPFSFYDMSSGMQRYLSFLIHLSFAPRGTVVLIDELESSFGINCLPSAIDFLLGRAPDLQLILTSHHPYIIQKIPTDLWKIVTRKGSHVRVLNAAEIPDLEESRSHLDRYTRLANLPAYADGIQP